MSTYDMAASSTLLDVAKSYNGKQLLECAEILDKKKGFMRVAKWIEANQITSHVYSKRVSLPTGTWRSVNEGTKAENPQREQDTEPLSRIDSRSEVDEYILDIEPNPKQRRYDEDMAHVEGLGQSIATAFYYGNAADDINKPTGVQVRFNDKSLANVHDNGCTDSASVTSLYIVQFGKKKCNLLYPREKGSNLIKWEDRGLERVDTDTSTGEALYKWVTKFSMMGGICIEDDRAIQRVCNIGTDGANEVDMELVIWALECLPDPEDMSDVYIFGNRLALHQIRKWLDNRPNIITSDKDSYGRQISRFGGAEIVLDEAIVNTEAVVS